MKWAKLLSVWWLKVADGHFPMHVSFWFCQNIFFLYTNFFVCPSVLWGTMLWSVAMLYPIICLGTYTCAFAPILRCASCLSAIKPRMILVFLTSQVTDFWRFSTFLHVLHMKEFLGVCDVFHQSHHLLLWARNYFMYGLMKHVKYFKTIQN